jgi:hypothetical protein
MKWYSMPIALVAYAILAVLIFVTIFNRITDEWPSQFWLILGAIACIYLLIAFILSQFKIQWEVAVLIQVILVLGPILWMVNNKEPYRLPVFVFLVPPDYTGKLEIRFSNDKQPQVRKAADTLFFAFDADGRIQLQEDYRMVKTAMQKNCYYLFPDRSIKKILFSTDSIPNNSLRELNTTLDGDRIKSIIYEIR